MRVRVWRGEMTSVGKSSKDVRVTDGYSTDAGISRLLPGCGSGVLGVERAGLVGGFEGCGLCETVGAGEHVRTQ